MSWLSALFSSVLAALGNMLLSAWKDDRADQDIKQGAVDKAAADTAQDIAETADAQAANNALDRGGARDVAARLRKRLGDQTGGEGDNDASR